MLKGVVRASAASLAETGESGVTCLHDSVVGVVFAGAGSILEERLCNQLEVRRNLVFRLVRAVRRKRFSQFLNSLAKVDRDLGFVSEGADQDVAEQSSLLGGADHDVGVVHADLESHPGDGLSHLDGLVLEHVEQLLDARGEDLGEGLLVGSI